MRKRISQVIIISPILVLAFALTLPNFGESPQVERPESGGVFRIKSFSDEFRMQLDPAQPESFIF
ncbi:MAG: hypothetical protein OEZ52_07220, partial [Candidatus Aminicenantes bacterium]|nr:hypothetical protein [Candidatus Aminicenantes bacterium]